MYWGLLRKEENAQRVFQKVQGGVKIGMYFKGGTGEDRGFKPAALKLPLSSCIALCGWSHSWR